MQTIFLLCPTPDPTPLPSDVSRLRHPCPFTPRGRHPLRPRPPEPRQTVCRRVRRHLLRTRGDTGRRGGVVLDGDSLLDFSGPPLTPAQYLTKGERGRHTTERRNVPGSKRRERSLSVRLPPTVWVPVNLGTSVRGSEWPVSYRSLQYGSGGTTQSLHEGETLKAPTPFPLPSPPPLSFGRSLRSLPGTVSSPSPPTLLVCLVPYVVTPPHLPRVLGPGPE